MTTLPFSTEGSAGTTSGSVALATSFDAPFSRDIADYPDGIVLPIDKPYRWTSADVVRKIKYAACRHFGKKNLKVGHAGTLYPLATGILLVCIGNATKRAEELQRSPKQYLAGVSFGATTPSYDLEKEIDRQFSLDGVSEDSVRALLPSFVGEQMQVAPLFSAKSVDGVRAYETARRLLRESQRTGVPFSDVDNILQSSLINIYGLELVAFGVGAGDGSVLPENGSKSGELGEKPAVFPENGAKSGELGEKPAVFPENGAKSGSFDTAVQGLPQENHASPCTASENQQGREPRIHVADVSGYELATAMIRVDCSKGTYIRALARDLGEALGSGAFLSSLRRTRNGGFDISQSLTLEKALELLGINP